MAPRNRSGASRLENTEPRQSLRKTRASRSTTRRIGGVTVTSLLVEGAAGQPEEDVLEGAAPHEHGGGPHPVAGEPLGGGVPVGGVDEEAVGQLLDLLFGGAQLGPGAVVLLRRGEAEL